MNTLLKTEENIYRNLNTLGLGILQMPGGARKEPSDEEKMRKQSSLA